MPWEPLPLETDPDAVTARILAGLAARMPGWTAYEGAPEVALAEEVGRETALLAARFVELVDLAVAGIGATVYGLPPIVATPATLLVDVTVTAPGDVIPDGLTVIGTTIDGHRVAYQLAAALTANDTVQQVTMTAIEPGANGNGIPAGQLLVVSTATASVVSATAAAGSAGGGDAETLTGYLDRLVDHLAVLRPGGVTGTDLALLAKSVPGVHRALGLDLHDPAMPGIHAPRTATVYALDTAGQPVPDSTKAVVRAELEAVRELNFRPIIADPPTTVVDVAVRVAPELGATPTAAQAAAETAIRAWLSPATWATSPGQPRSWIRVPVVRYLELATVISSAPGVGFITGLTLNGAAADVPLADPVGLPKPGTITVGPVE
ncbi:MAG: baseplate J/gp47 family protein [Microthrixaceae bacterium]|jgi:uncharacterized phage protein gp47/JayE|nr:baseplate J/gp47 family protein [Microthrixaceae bacterium]